MWEFPSIASFIGNSFFLFAVTFVMLFVSIILWKSFYSSITGKTIEFDKDLVQTTAFALGTFAIALFCFWGIVSKYREMANCRNLDLTKITAVKVKQMATEDTFGAEIIKFSDSNKIREGLKILNTSYSRSRDRDNFANGYQLQLILENQPSEFYLEYFPETNRGKKSDVIIPRCNAAPNGFSSDGAGIFYSTPFGNWIRENIEPQFENVQ